MEANNQLSGFLGRLFAISEAYPELKANTSFENLQAQLVEVENKIRFARQFYNDTVTEYNQTIQMFPGSLFAGFLTIIMQSYLKQMIWQEKKYKLNFKLRWRFYEEKFLMSIVVAALVVFGVKTYYDKKTTNNDQVSVEKENKGSNETGTNEISNEMLVPGYALGEIPPITAPEMPDLSVKENPNAKITLDMTEKYQLFLVSMLLL